MSMRIQLSRATVKDSIAVFSMPIGVMMCDWYAHHRVDRPAGAPGTRGGVVRALAPQPILSL